MYDEAKNIIEPDLYDALIELSKQDVIVKSVVDNSNNEAKLINSLVAAIVCITERELTNAEKINTLLKSNPEVQKILERKNDQALLSASKS